MGDGSRDGAISGPRGDTEIAAMQAGREKHQRGERVKPGDVSPTPHASAHSAANVMTARKGNVHFEGQVDVHGAGEKRNRHQGKAHQEAEEIEVRPSHKAPRNAAPRCVDWNPRR